MFKTSWTTISIIGQFCVNSSSLKIPLSDRDKSRSSAEEEVTQLSGNHGDKAKAGVGNQDPPSRHAAANSDTPHDTPAQRAAQVSGCSAPREWGGLGGGVKDQRIQQLGEQQCVQSTSTVIT